MCVWLIRMNAQEPFERCSRLLLIAKTQLGKTVGQEVVLIERCQVRRLGKSIDGKTTTRTCQSRVGGGQGSRNLNRSRRCVRGREVRTVDKIVVQSLDQRGFNGERRVVVPLPGEMPGNLSGSANGLRCNVAIDRFIHATHSRQCVAFLGQARQPARGSLEFCERFFWVAIHEGTAAILVQQSPVWL